MFGVSIKLPESLWIIMFKKHLPHWVELVFDINHIHKNICERFRKYSGWFKIFFRISGRSFPGGQELTECSQVLHVIGLHVNLHLIKLVTIKTEMLIGNCWNRWHTFLSVFDLRYLWWRKTKIGETECICYDDKSFYLADFGRFPFVS